MNAKPEVTYYSQAVELLQQLIATPSFSGSEAATAGIIAGFLSRRGLAPRRLGNNVWVTNRYFEPGKPTLLLHSHHDTVKPVSAYTRDPFNPQLQDGRLYGLGSNDAGGSLVALIMAFLAVQHQPGLKWNLLLAAGAEEENSGPGGLSALLPQLGTIDAAIVGEPTSLGMAVAERGLMVLDCTAAGIAGHAARATGRNAIYEALEDICWFRDYRFEQDSELLGPVQMSVTMLSAGSQHNVVPDACRFTVDVRLNEHYTHEQLLDTIRASVRCRVEPRSTRLRSTHIAADHPLVQAGLQLGLKPFGSPTLSDKALMPFPALKIGPGRSERSHTADEYLELQELQSGIDTYINLLNILL